MRQNTTVFKVIQEILFWLKLRKVAIISKFGSEESEKASIKVAKIFLSRKITVYTVSPASVPGTKTVEETEDLKKEKIDLAITLGGDGTTLRAFRGLGNEKLSMLGIKRWRDDSAWKTSCCSKRCRFCTSCRWK